MQPRLQRHYHQEVIPIFRKEFKVKSDYAVPRIEKVVLNVGLAEPDHQDQALQNMTEQLKVITGQSPRLTRAKKSIAGFKLRAGAPIGLMVTLRGRRMYQFLEKFVQIVLPRFKDFQGVARSSFDGHGNYNIGLEEQIVFPEIEYDKIDKIRGLQITIVTTTHNKKYAERLLELIGMPFKKDEQDREAKRIGNKYK